ncbi:MAG: hypothetical protein CMI31_03305 [Opitutae bacterium]|nr:hypothetical protein [Opitutae bacterium]
MAFAGYSSKSLLRLSSVFYFEQLLVEPTISERKEIHSRLPSFPSHLGTRLLSLPESLVNPIVRRGVPIAELRCRGLLHVIHGQNRKVSTQDLRRRPG